MSTVFSETDCRMGYPVHNNHVHKGISFFKWVNFPNKDTHIDRYLTGLTVFNILMENFSMFLCASPKQVKASLAAGWGSRTPMEENTSPNAEICVYMCVLEEMDKWRLIRFKIKLISFLQNTVCIIMHLKDLNVLVLCNFTNFFRWISPLYIVIEKLDTMTKKSSIKDYSITTVISRRQSLTTENIFKKQLH